MSVPTRRAPGAERAAASTPGREGQRGHVVHGEAGALGAGARGCHAARTGGYSRGAWTRAAHHRTDRHPGVAVGAADAGRPEACKSDFPAGSPRMTRFLFFFQILKRFQVFFLSFSLFFFRLLSPKAAEAAATRGGERRLGEPPLHLYPPAPGAAGRRAPGDLGAVVPAHSARGPEAGRPHERDPVWPRCATATPGARRTARGPVPDPRAGGHARL